MNKTLRTYMRVFSGAHILVPLALVLFASGPLFFNDNACMIYFMRRATQWYNEFGALWGYDPSFAAGFPLNFTWNSNLGLQFLAVLFHPIPEYILLLIETAGFVMIAPLCFTAGMKNFGLKGSALNAALIVMLAYWWSGSPAMMLLLGMPSAILALHLCFYTLSLFYKFFTEDDPRITARLYIMVPLCFIAHKTALVMLGVPAALLFMLHLRSAGARRLAHLAGISALTIAVNSFWLIPFLNLLKYKVSLAEAPHGLSLDPLRIFKDYFTLSKIMGPRPLEPNGGSAIFLFFNTVIRDGLMAFGIYGIVRWWRSGRKALAAFFAAHTVLFLGEIYFGSFWSVTAELYPTRYISNLDLMLAIPAAAGLQSAYAAYSNRPSGPSRLLRLGKLAPVVLLIGAVLPYVMFTSMVNTRPDKDTLRLTAFLRDGISGGGRVLLEDSGWNDRDSIRNDAPPKYGKSQFPAVISDLTGRELIGGPYPYLFLVHHYADFHDAQFLHKPLTEFSTAEMRHELDRYNIRWISCWSGDCKKYFSSDKASYSRIGKFGIFEVFERAAFVDNPFLLGSGFAISDQRGIRCYRVRPDGGKVALKYHALEQLTVSGAGGTGTFKSGKDPVGFIELSNPPEYFRITNDYEFK